MDSNEQKLIDWERNDETHGSLNDSDVVPVQSKIAIIPVSLLESQDTYKQFKESNDDDAQSFVSRKNSVYHGLNTMELRTAKTRKNAKKSILDLNKQLSQEQGQQ